MANAQFHRLWSNHPYPHSPCDLIAFKNQCGYEHRPAHILGAQELANWLKAKLRA